VSALIGTTAAGHQLDIGLDDLIGAHLIVAANSGGGKSGAIRKLLESTHGQVQQIILDAEDEFYTLRERYDYVIAGGEGGDTPATVDTAAALAQAALSHGFSLIAQINDLPNEPGKNAAVFIATFLEALLAAPRDQWRPILLVIDEAQRFAPTKGSSEAAEALKDLLQRGRKRGFTAVLATTRISELDAGVRGLARNWMLGFVGQTLDRKTAAEQLGFPPSSAEARGLQHLEPRQFWGFGPAISRTAVLFTVAAVETTIVKSGQAKVPTPPAPEALREILAGLAAAPASDALISAPSSEGANLRAAAMEQRALAAEDMLSGFIKAHRLAGHSLSDIGEALALLGQRFDALSDTLNFADAIAFSAERHLVPNGWVRPGVLADKIPAQGGGGPEVDEGQTEGRQVMTSAAPRVQAPAPAARTAMEKAGGGNASPAALAIADLLDRINPARVTWTQAATLTGRKASGGNFNAARKWLRESGRLIEDGEFIRSSQPEPAGMTRAEALELWRSVLRTPAPRMIDALSAGPLTREQLGAALGAAPRGGNFNSGLAQLRRNGVAVEISGMIGLATVLPGEKA